MLFKCSNKVTFCKKNSDKACCCENFQQNKFFWKSLIKAIFFLEIFNKGIFWWKLAIRQLFVEISNKVAAVFVEIFQQNWIFFMEIFHENSATLGGNFATKPREFWWTFPQNPQNCQNFRAATLPRCKGFCDSGDTWHLTHDMWHIVWDEHSLKISAP